MHHILQQITMIYYRILIWFVSTRHDSHANLSLKALKKGKHVFVEKPAVINRDETKMISERMIQILKVNLYYLQDLIEI